jgi:hypothetical protein
MSDDGFLYDVWRPVGEEIVTNVEVPTAVNGFGAPVQTITLPIYRRRERRKVWKFVGWEERTVES